MPSEGFGAKPSYMMLLVRLLIPFLLVSLQAADTAPDVHTVSGKFERVVVVRLKYGTDILEGLNKAVAKEKIANAVILSGHGSVTSYHLHVVSSTALPPKDAFFKGEGAYDVLGAQGHIINGRVHAHMTLASTTKVIGGHLEPGTKAYTFIAIALGVLSSEANLDRIDDWNWR